MDSAGLSEDVLLQRLEEVSARGPAARGVHGLAEGSEAALLGTYDVPEEDAPSARRRGAAEQSQDVEEPRRQVAAL